jgi:hypothetical protein
MLNLCVQQLQLCRLGGYRRQQDLVRLFQSLDDEANELEEEDEIEEEIEDEIEAENDEERFCRYL